MRFFLSLMLLSGAAHGADWPAFLGPHGDGTSEETGWNQDWSRQQPRKLWEAEIGTGCASIVVAGGRAVTAGQREAGQDTVYCLDAFTGLEIWKFSYAQKLEPTYYSGGPSATPAIDDERVFVLSKDGALFCLDFKTGRLVWQKHLVMDFGGVKQQWGYAAAPLVAGDLLICEPGGKGSSLIALKKETGDLVWKTGSDAAAYATPVRFDHDGVSGLACFNQFGLVGYDLAGKELFRQEWKTQYDVNSSPPLHRDGRFLIASSYGNGGALIAALPGPPKVLWKNKGLLLQFQNMALAGDCVYAVTGDNTLRATLKCIRFDTGELKWEERLRENRGSIIQAAGKFIILSESGEAILMQPDPAGFRELGRMQANRKPCWAPPALADGLLFTRNNDGRVTCLDMR